MLELFKLIELETLSFLKKKLILLYHCELIKKLLIVEFQSYDVPTIILLLSPHSPQPASMADSLLLSF